MKSSKKTGRNSACANSAKPDAPAAPPWTPFELLPAAEREAWHARAGAALEALKPYFQPWTPGLRYAGSHAAHLSLWLDGLTRDLGLVTLPDAQSETLPIKPKEGRAHA